MDLIFYQILVGLFLCLSILLAIMVRAKNKKISKTRKNHQFLQKIILEARSPMMICKQDFNPIFVNHELKKVFDLAPDLPQKKVYFEIQKQMQTAIHSINFHQKSGERLIQLNQGTYAFISRKINNLNVIELILQPQSVGQKVQNVQQARFNQQAQTINLYDLIENGLEDNMNYLSSKNVFIDIKSPVSKIYALITDQNRIKNSFSSMIKALVPLINNKPSKKIICEIDEYNHQKILKFFIQGYDFNPTDLYLNQVNESSGTRNLPNLIQRFEYIEKSLNPLKAKISMNQIKDLNGNCQGTEFNLTFTEPYLQRHDQLVQVTQNTSH